MCDVNHPSSTISCNPILVKYLLWKAESDFIECLAGSSTLCLFSTVCLSSCNKLQILQYVILAFLSRSSGDYQKLRLQARGAGGGREKAHYVKNNLNTVKDWSNLIVSVNEDKDRMCTFSVFHCFLYLSNGKLVFVGMF